MVQLWNLLFTHILFHIEFYFLIISSLQLPRFHLQPIKDAWKKRQLEDGTRGNRIVLSFTFIIFIGITYNQGPDVIR